MTRLTLALTAALILTPTLAQAQNHQVRIGIECFRGPWQEIIWDRPEVGFTDDLVAYGYSFAEAEAIGTRVCRDPQGIDDPHYLVGVVRHLLRTQPPR
jgi:hypothetical protein